MRPPRRTLREKGTLRARSGAGNKLEVGRDWADLILKCVSIGAIIGGGYWAYYQFAVTETTAYNVEIEVTTETLPYSRDLRLFLIHAKPKNIGKVLALPDKSGFIVTIWRIPSDTKPGALDLAALPEYYTTDLLTRFPDGYELEPGVEYDEVVALVAPKGSLFAVEALLNLGDDTEVDQTTVARVDDE